MTTLRNILQLHLADSRNQGGSSSTELIRELTIYRNRLFWSLTALLVVIVLVVGFGAFLIATHVNEPSKLAIFSSALGLSAGGGVEMCRRMWSEWSRAGLLALLVQDAPEAVIQNVVDKLLDKL